MVVDVSDAVDTKPPPDSRADIAAFYLTSPRTELTSSAQSSLFVRLYSQSVWREDSLTLPHGNSSQRRRRRRRREGEED